MKTEHLSWLKVHDACEDSIEWIEENSISTLKEAWNLCERGDWLLWMAERLGVDKRKLTLCAALCAHTVVQYMEDTRSRNAVRIVFLWGRGKATDAQLEAAKKEATDVAAAAARAATRAAVWAAAAADDAARAAAARADAWADAAWAAAGWADAARAAAWVARAADDAKKNQRKTSEIARKILTNDVIKKIKEIK